MVYIFVVYNVISLHLALYSWFNHYIWELFLNALDNSKSVNQTNPFVPHWLSEKNVLKWSLNWNHQNRKIQPERLSHKHSNLYIHWSSLNCTKEIVVSATCMDFSFSINMVMHSAMFRFWQHSVGYILTGRLGKLNPSKINGQPSRRLQKGKQRILFSH